MVPLLFENTMNGVSTSCELATKGSCRVPYDYCKYNGTIENSILCVRHEALVYHEFTLT